MPYVRTDDRVRLYYEEHGPTDPDATGSPLVLAYGIGGNADLWDVNIPALAGRHRLVLWEPRGHARSDSPQDPARYSFARWVLDLKAVLDGLRLRTAHVGGLSLGAGIATRFTLAFPARVRALLVTNSSSAAGLPLSSDNLVMRAQSIKVTLERGMDAMAEFAMASNPNVAARLALDPSSKDEFYAYYRRLTPIGYANALRALLAMDHNTDRVANTRMPQASERPTFELPAADPAATGPFSLRVTSDVTGACPTVVQPVRKPAQTIADVSRRASFFMAFLSSLKGACFTLTRRPR